MVTGGMTTEILTRKCIACGHDNSPGGDSCVSCGSSLDLKLCPACEAINGAGAARCHACGDAFTSARAGESIDGRVVAVLREPYVTKSFARRGKRYAMLFGVVLGMLSLPLYLLIAGFANRGAPAAERQQPAAAQQQVKTATITAAKTRADAPKVSEATTGVVATADAGAPRPAVPVTGVTHTRRADAPVSKTVSPEKPAPVAAVNTAPVPAEKTAPAAVIAKPPTGDAAPAALAHPHVRVTHTKATAADAAVVPVAGVATKVNSLPERSASAGNGRAPECDERLAALGFCNRNGKSGGNK